RGCVEVASDRSGSEPVSPADDARTSRIRLNVALYAATVLSVCIAVFLVVVLARGDDSTIDGVNVAPGAGEDVGRGVVEAVPVADEADQLRVAAQIEAASTMVDAFVNFNYKEADATIKAVQSMSTGTFLEQYNKGAADLKKLA